MAKLKQEDIIELARLVISKEVKPLPAVPKPINIPSGKADKEDVVLLLSDLQVGHKTKTTDVAAIRRRMKTLARNLLKVVSLERKGRPIDRLWVLILGDTLQNELLNRFVSLDELEIVVGEQVKVASDLIAQFLLQMAMNFKNVEVRAVRGNHGQTQEYAANKSNWDDVVYDRARLLTSQQDNVHWEISDSFYQFVDIRNHRFLLVHGDQIRSYQSTPIYGINMRCMRWYGSLGAFDYLVLGHFHCPHSWTLNNVGIFINGCFVSDDEYVLKRMGFSSITQQYAFGVHSRRGVSWQMKIDLDK